MFAQIELGGQLLAGGISLGGAILLLRLLIVYQRTFLSTSVERIASLERERDRAERERDEARRALAECQDKNRRARHGTNNDRDDKTEHR